MPSENEPRPRAGERRHLTVMFCDIVGSSRLAGQLDPEDWDEILSAYHQTCEASRPPIRRLCRREARRRANRAFRLAGCP